MAESKQKETGEFSQTHYLHSHGGRHEQITSLHIMAYWLASPLATHQLVLLPLLQGPTAVHTGSIGKA
jgi:hypothetical protein